MVTQAAQWEWLAVPGDGSKEDQVVGGGVAVWVPVALCVSVGGG